MKSGFEGWIFAAIVISVFVLIPMAVILINIASKNVNERRERLAVLELLDRMR